METDPEQVARFNSECVRAFNAGETSYLFQIRNMTAEERSAADEAQEKGSPLRGTYHRALIILQPSPNGTERLPGVNGRFTQTDYIPEADPHGTHLNR